MLFRSLPFLELQLQMGVVGVKFIVQHVPDGMAVDGQEGLSGPNPRSGGGAAGGHLLDRCFRDGRPLLSLCIKKRKRGSPPPLFSYWTLVLLDLSEHLTVVSHAGLAQSVGQTICAALGASGHCGSRQLPVCTPLIPSLLGDFALRNRHFETPPC